MQAAGTTPGSNAKDKPRIGYVGIGLMGLPMTRRLLERGYTVSVFDIVSERTELARAAGARVAASPADAVRGADLVLLNLPTTDAVELVVFGDEGVASAIEPSQLLVDFSTVKVEKGRSLAAQAAAEDRLRLGRRTGVGRTAGLCGRHADRHGRWRTG